MLRFYNRRQEVCKTRQGDEITAKGKRTNRDAMERNTLGGK